MVDTSTRSTVGQTAPARLPLISREHGANLMAVHALLLGLVAGIVAGHASPLGAGLAAGLVALFLPFAAAVSSLSRSAVRERARRRIVVIAAAMAASSALALLVGPASELLAVGAVAAVLGVVYAVTRAATGPRHVVTELVAIAGISLFAPLAWLLSAGPTSGWQLAGPAAFLAFGGTVPYVRERVHRRKQAALPLAVRLRRGAPAIVWHSVALAAAAAVGLAASVSWLLPFAFVPGLLKTVGGIAAPERRPRIARIGMVETVVSTIFAVLAGIALAV